MALHLSSSVSELPGIGQTAVKDLRNMGISSVKDLLLNVPFRYDDFSQIKQIRQLRPGETVTVIGTIQSIKTRSAKRRHVKVIEAVLEDETGTLPVIWFNQEYLLQTIPPGTTLALAGTMGSRFQRSLVNPIHEPVDQMVLTGHLVPVYRLSGSLKMYRVRRAVQVALRTLEEWTDWLPEHIRTAEQMPDLASAIRTIHAPQTQEELSAAINRLKFDELFLHQLMFAHVRRERTVRCAPPIEIDEHCLKTFVASLPFTLTQDQRRAAWEIVQDLAREQPMNRLLQGDVGSGKTAVAAVAIANVLASKKLVIYLAPTEILCAQQHAVFSAWFPSESIALFTRSQKRLGDQAAKKEDVLEGMKSGSVRCVIGTHALLEESVDLSDVTLIIIDEQHRFGVAQRHALLKRSAGSSPHLLSMTATPIPRSLALTIFGDLDISSLRQLPQGRRPVGTAVVSPVQQSGMWAHINEEIKKGRQAYVVCPLIDPSDALGAKSVKEVSAQMKKEHLSGVHLEVLHGKMKSDEKQTVLENFRGKKIDVLVSTTVVEVGVDVPNATVMVVMGAERFGLAQLHQLRGRIGRSDLQSFCYLLPDHAQGTALERLCLLERIQDGFELAEKDMRLRGAGNIFGTAQSGFPDFKLATEADVDLMKKAHDWATKLLEVDPMLQQHPLVHEQMQNSFDSVHLE